MHYIFILVFKIRPLKGEFPAVSTWFCDLPAGELLISHCKSEITIYLDRPAPDCTLMMCPQSSSWHWQDKRVAGE